MNRQYIIWGTGVRGKCIYEVLGDDNVLAFIDSDEGLIGRTFCGKSIISLESYCKSFKQYFIIISPVDYKPMVQLLSEREISQYFLLSECPSEFIGHGIPDILDKLPLQYNTEGCYGIYGINLFSVLVYDALRRSGCKRLYLIPQSHAKGEFLQQVMRIYDDYDIRELEWAEQKIDKLFLVCEKDIDNILKEKKGNYSIENAFDFSDRIEEYYHPEVETLKNSQEGKRCFIVATGPSLRMEDLDKLKENKELCLSVNGIFRAFDKTNWRPQYYMVEDAKAENTYFEDIVNTDLEHIFIRSEFQRLSDHLKGRNLYKYHLQFELYKPELPKFSEDVSRKIYAGNTVTYSAIQLAVYLGFKEIYLIGVDHNYSDDPKNPNNHFSHAYYKDDSKAGPYMYEETTLSYQKAEQYANEHGIKIYNATRGGKLEVFERIDFDRCFVKGSDSDNR